MPNLPDRHSLEALRAFDTPTICNALEIVVPARRALGFTRRPLAAPFPELKPVIGFARTARAPPGCASAITSTSPPSRCPASR